MTIRRKLVMATNNAGKLREARAIAGDRLEILSLEDIGFHQDIEETADTLEGNALIKVRTIKNATGFDCFADDTGLMVDALGGAPGVHTARYAGEDCNPERNIDLMLKNMEGMAERRARFRTCVALSLDGEEHIFEGTVEGKIATERCGTHGFGYDPIFIPEETGISFAEMSDDSKNTISHRARAITSMMKWLSTLCISIFWALGSNAASSDWRLFNTFDDKIEHIFDTSDKTYFLVHAQLYDKYNGDNDEKLFFLFCKDKSTGETRAYNSLNFLSKTIIKKANYNARKKYLTLVYEDSSIDILHDDGKTYTIDALKNYNSDSSNSVRSISFDPDHNRVFFATDFGFIIIDDSKYEVASSGIFNQPVDYVCRIADRLLIAMNNLLYQGNADAGYFKLSEFCEVDWGGSGEIRDLRPISSDRCLLARSHDNNTTYYNICLESGMGTPTITDIGKLDNAYISENKDGLFFARYGSAIQLGRNTSIADYIRLRNEDASLPCGSWDFHEFQIGRPREGFYSVRRDSPDSWNITEQVARPNAPAVFRCNSLMYTPRHGMLANTHGIDRNFSSRNALNPILLSGLKDQEWNMYGLPYLDRETALRLVNPCGMAQDPDNPDVFYFGSIHNGMLRYNIKDMSSLLHMTKSDDSPEYPGHVSVQDPYSSWSNTFMVANPVFDIHGNLLAAHMNTEVEQGYFPEIWIWTPEDRLASTSPETFRPFTRLKVEGIGNGMTNLIIPLTSKGNQDKLAFFPINHYRKPFAVYDHNGTPKENNDDRQVALTALKDNDGTLDFNYFYCALEDPTTGLVWVGTDNGVFTFDPSDAFSDPGKVSRIKVNRNDGTSLADYLLDGISVNNIAIDGLARKWFSLSGGGLICTSADGKTILMEFNNENSPLPSDMVYTSCYNPDTNSMMIATSAGLCEYFMRGLPNESAASDVRAFPNPVRHDYYGWVTIDGLEEDCIVKISDSAGNIIRELGPASGGRVQWDVCGIDLNRVPSGVYYVLASSGPGAGTYSEAIKILVINR